VEPRFNEPLSNEVVDITNNFLYLKNSKIYEKETRYNESRYSEQILSVPGQVPLYVEQIH